MSFLFLRQLKKIGPYINADIREDLLKHINEHQRLFYLTDKYFIKISKPDNITFRESLRNDIANQDFIQSLNINVPEIVYRYAGRELFIKIEKRLHGRSLCENRNDFCLNSDVNVDEIVKEIAKIRQNSAVRGIKNDFSNYSKINQYLYKIDNDMLGDELIARCEKLADLIKSQKSSEKYLSHGDTLPTNIRIGQDGKIYFVDWEWMGLRDKMYDTVLFVLFTKPPYEAILEIEKYVGEEDLRGAYINAAVIALKEMKNWSLVKEDVKVQYLDIWRKTLEIALNKLQIS